MLAIWSPGYILRGLSWNLSIYKHQTTPSLGIGLESASSEKESREMKMSVKLLSSRNDVDPIEKSNADQVKWPGSLDIESIISWDEILKPENGYVNNNSITLEVKVEAGKPKEDSDVSGVNVDQKCEVTFSPFQYECSICMERFSQGISSTQCGHMFCTECIHKPIEDRVCPVCQAPVQYVCVSSFFSC